MVTANDADAVIKVGAHAPSRGVIARGLGRSYNDAAQNSGGVVLDVTPNRGLLDLDEAAGMVTIGPGVSIGELIEAYLPCGLFPPVSPGTRHVTVGGAIAADVHGKNHHRDGSFGRFVQSMRLWTPNGGVMEASPTANAELFWATVGGMGLTGVIIDATIKMQAVETGSMVVDSDRAADIDQAMALMTDEDGDYPYSVAWIDCQTSGRRLGRSVLTRGRHATLDELPSQHQIQALRPHARPTLPAPPWVPNGLINRLTVRAFNEVWFRSSPRRRRDHLQPHGSFFYPLDRIDGWNRLYGSRGFLQYQFVVPFGQEDMVRGVVELLSSWGAASFLAVLKRFGPGSAGHLSFPMPGWTLALDLPVARDGLGRLLDEIDDRVVAAGGRCYLAKDGRMRPEMVGHMYPRLDEWRAVRNRADPDGVLRSDLDRRLNLTGRGLSA
ncbi:MAG: FAD-binding oxidoreductase [Acidimicrobiales bacterium]